MGKIRVGLIGIGNCASSLVQGCFFYREAKEGEKIPGLIRPRLGAYHIRDIEICLALDVDKNKVGKDLGEAIFCPPNNTIQFFPVKETGVKVLMGNPLDGLGQYLSQRIEVASEKPIDLAQALRQNRVEVVVNFLPVGSEKATEWYADQALRAGCGLVNCIPVFIARDAGWRQRFEQAGLPLIGDDIKSQLGATILHRQLARLFSERGVLLEHTSQLNVGGNMDFYNMLERSRLESKKISKTDAVLSQLDQPLDPSNVHIGPSDYVPWLADRKWAYIRMEGRSFGEVPIHLELKLEVWDSPNAAAIAIDALRCCRIGLDRGLRGALLGPSAYFMKSPPLQYSDARALSMLEEFIGPSQP
ncbi:MAG: inositol-3-phosphate synthase [candidate division NC10 bacterium]|nr:inositol-3-phosphate synthase [candidate division NC10 bacterium]